MSKANKLLEFYNALAQKQLDATPAEYMGYQRSGQNGWYALYAGGGSRFFGADFWKARCEIERIFGVRNFRLPRKAKRRRVRKVATCQLNLWETHT